MASLQTSPTLHRTLFQNSFPQVLSCINLLYIYCFIHSFLPLIVIVLQKHGSSSSSSSTFRRREGISFIVKAEQELSSSSTGCFLKVSFILSIELELQLLL